MNITHYTSILLCSSVGEQVLTRNVPGSIPGMTYFFFWAGEILVRGTDLRIEFAAAGGTPQSCDFGMLCPCVMRSHAAHAEGTFCSVVAICVLVLSTLYMPFFVFLSALGAGRGVTWGSLMRLSVDDPKPPHPEEQAGLALQGPDPEPTRGLLVEEQAECQGEELLSDPLDVGVFVLQHPYPCGPFLPNERPPFPLGKRNVLLL